LIKTDTPPWEADPHVEARHSLGRGLNPLSKPRPYLDAP